jgi:DNA-binding CsgD family transcriptional regulator
VAFESDRLAVTIRRVGVRGHRGKPDISGCYRSRVSNPTRRPELVGREEALDLARAWLDRLGGGASGLVIRGEPGIGKTSLWTQGIEEAVARSARVLATRPVEAELPLGYAGLGDVLGPVVDQVLAGLPEPQAHALSAALSLDIGTDTGDPLLVGRATVAVIRLLAAQAPVVIAVDDVQWLDPPSARALAFAARRVADLPVGFALSVRSGHAEPLGVDTALGDRLIEVELDGLSLGALSRLIRTRVDPDMARHSLVRIHARSAGNPLFAIQLARAGDGALPATLVEMVARQLDGVGPEAGAAIELAAVLGPQAIAAFVDVAGLDAAIEAAVLVEDRGEVRFAHPLLAAGAYARIPPGRRRELHREVALRSDSAEDQARHLALAASGPDAETAAFLEEAAHAASRRGAPETAVELAVHAVRLTPLDDREDRGRRTMDQADYLHLAADEPAARRLVDELLAGPVRATTRVRALTHRAMLETDPAAAVAHLEAAVAEPHGDPSLAARTLTQLAWQRGAWLGDLDAALVEATAALEATEVLSDPAALVSALTTVGLLMSLVGHPGAADQFRRALEITLREPGSATDHSLRPAFAHERMWRGDFAAADELLRDERETAEQRGDEGLLMRLRVFGAVLALARGAWDDAERLLEQALIDARDYWRVQALVQRVVLRARRGDVRALEDAATIRESDAARSDPITRAAAEFGAGLLDLAAGNVAGAADRMAPLSELSDRGGSRGVEYAVLIPETVAVLVEAGRADRAETLVEQLERRHVQLEPWGAAAAALCRGLLALGAGDVGAAETCLATGRIGFEALGAPWELAQTLFAEGRLLRRIGRRREAAASLERSIELFAELGAVPSIARAADELRRARPRPRHDDSLTTAESRVASLVAAGGTNREVAARLFTTVATVEAHLTRIYAKLGIRSRSELARQVSDGSVHLEPPS